MYMYIFLLLTFFDDRLLFLCIKEIRDPFFISIITIFCSLSSFPLKAFIYIIYI